MEIIILLPHIILLHKNSNHSTHIWMFVRSNKHSNLAKFVWALVHNIYCKNSKIGQACVCSTHGGTATCMHGCKDARMDAKCNNTNNAYSGGFHLTSTCCCPLHNLLPQNYRQKHINYDYSNIFIQKDKVYIIVK